MKSKIKWTEAENMRSPSGEPQVYYSEMSNGKKVFLQRLRDNSWDVLEEASPNTGWCCSYSVNCKTLTSAKRWVARYLIKKE